jgi:hypothetical protein
MCLAKGKVDANNKWPDDIRKMKLDVIQKWSSMIRRVQSVHW